MAEFSPPPPPPQDPYDVLVDAVRDLRAGGHSPVPFYSKLLRALLVLRSIPLEDALALGVLSVAAVSPETATHEQLPERLLRAFTMYRAWVSTGNKRTEQDIVLGFTYDLLRRRAITWAEAAEIASAIPSIARGKRFSQGAWKMRVTRYQESRKLPKVGQRRRPPPGQPKPT